MIRKKASVSIVLVIVAFAFSMFLGGLMGGEEAFAGAYIGSNTSYGSGGSSGSSGDSGNCRGTDSEVDCMGVSWIYYAATGYAGWGGRATHFSPNMHSGPYIPAECSLPGRGFWAFGVGGYGKKYSNDSFASFRSANRDRVHGNSTATNQFSTGVGNYGLQGVYPWGYHGDWNVPYRQRKYTTFTGNLNHNLFNNNGGDIWTYYAAGYGHIGNSASGFVNPDGSVSSSEVFRQFKMAYAYDNNGAEYNDSNFPDDLTFFCYWPDMEKKYTLTMNHINAEYNNDILSDNSVTVFSGQRAEVGRSDPGGEWRFLGICSAKWWCADLGWGSSFAVDPMTSDVVVHAVYGPRRFQGLAQVKSGSLDSNTGWTFNSSDAAISVDCPNTGCQAIFNLGLLKTGGPNSTHYFINKYDSNSGDTIIQPLIETYSADGRSLVYTTEDMKPGQKICYYLSWEPWGPYGRNEYQTVSACATAKISNFQGISSVTGAASGTTDWQSSYKRQSVFIRNCSPLTGCDVYFNHSMRKNPNHGYADNSDQNGTLGWSDYIIRRTSNMTTSDKRIPNDDNVASGTFYASWGERQVGVTTGPFKLYPGMVLCETLSFRNNNKDGLSSPTNTDTRACASALGDAQPPDPAQSECDVASDCVSDPNGDQGNDALTDIEVKNTSVTKYNTYRRVVYAKPTDEIWYRASYNPNVQYTYFLKPEQIRINSNGTIYPGRNSINTSKSMGTMFNEIKSPGWNNAIIVRSFNFQSLSYSRNHIFENGDISKRTETTNPEFVNKHKVVPSEVGLSLNENSEFNYSGNSRIRTTPTQVTFTDNGQWNLGTVSILNHYRTAYARIPYNYDTAITIPEPEPKDPENPDDPESPMPNTKKPEIAYAGEKKEIEVVADIIPKYNRVTMNSEDDEPYATKTGRSTIKIIVYIADSPKVGHSNWPGTATATRSDDLCAYFGYVKDQPGTSWGCGQFDLFTRVDNVSTTNLNNNGNMDGATHKWNTSFNAPDLDAGKHICVATALYPANSGPAINYNDPDGSHTWRISDSRCYVIAKRPNLQVLGGGVFSAGKLSTSISEKKNLYGIYKTEIASGINTTVFGSWAEHQVVSMGVATGFASGASTGYFGGDSGSPPPSGRTPIAGLGGSKEGERVYYCIRTPLTFANMYPCSYNSYAGNFTNGGAASPINVKDKDKLIAKFTQNQEFSGVSYQKIEGDATVGATTVAIGMTEVIHATGDITITGNITYASGPYQKLGDIPKMIIYAEKNIKIDCGVNTVNAVLIAGKTNRSYSGTVGIVDTCPTEFSRYNNNLESEVNWKYKEGGANITLINSRRNSNTLRIIGTVIANRLSANRTYGAAKGVNSIVPAEVIDYDTSLYLWGARESESSASGRLQTVYKHELAPRY